MPLTSARVPFKTCHFVQEASVLLARRGFGTRLGWVQTLFSPLPTLRPLTVGSSLTLSKMGVIMLTLQISQEY